MDATSRLVSSTGRVQSESEAEDVRGSRTGRPGLDRLAPDRRTVTIGELAVLVAAVVVAMLAISSLAFAHLHHYTLGHAMLGTVAGLVLLAALARFTSPLPRVVLDRAGLAVLAVTGLLALFMFLPGFHYAAGDRDPGGYIMSGSAIARTGSVSFTDPVLASDLPVTLQSPGARFRGIWISDARTGRITPQFYHLWSALLATAGKLHGFNGQSNVDPLVGVVAVLLLVCIARRLGGLVGAGAAGLLMSTQMMQVWQAKYPTAEVFAQMLLLGAALGLILAFQTRWRWPAFVAGVLVGADWLARPDGVLVVLLAVGAGSTLYVLRRFDARGWWFAAGFAPVTGYAAYQAYGPAAVYSRDNQLPGLPVIAGLIMACVAGALLLRPLLGRLATRVNGLAESVEWQRRVGLGIVGLYAALFGLALVRPAFGPSYGVYLGRPIRTYDEFSLYWLSWFFSWPGLLLVLVGIGYVALRRWTPASWVIVIPTLLLLPLYAWHSRNSPFLMWWSRRYVSYVLPGMVLLIALGLAGIWAVRHRLLPRFAGTGGAAVLTVFLLVVYLHQSLPLRQHDEWGGTYGVATDVAKLGNGAQGVFLWQREQYCCTAAPTLFAGPVWLEQGQISVLLPGNPAALPRYVTAYVRHFPDKPVFLVYERGTPPPMQGLRVSAIREFAGVLPRWAESSITRPATAERIPYGFTVYRVTRWGMTMQYPVPDPGRTSTPRVSGARQGASGGHRR
jgi:hypothetical protein